MDIRSKIFGYVLGDGWIDVKKNGGISGEAESLKTIAADVNLIYGDNSAGEICTKQTHSCQYGISGTTSSFTIKKRVVDDLLRLGMPIGRRVLAKYNLPYWVLNGTKEIKASFLSGYYAADGMIPSVQRNRETPRPLSFCFYKSADLEKSGDNLAEQYRSIVSDLGFSTSLSKITGYTDGPRLIYTITINNQRDEFLQQLETLDLNYCKYREERRLQLIQYLKMKQEALNKLRALRDKVICYRKDGKTYKEISQITGLSQHKIGDFISGHNKCNRIVGFPKFDEDFIRMCSPIKTPLNDETPSVNER